MEKEILGSPNLLDEQGKLQTIGYSKHFNIHYNPQNSKLMHRLKEWDFYQITNREWCLQMNISHLSYISSVSVTLFHIKTNVRYSLRKMKLFSRITLDDNNETDHSITYRSHDHFEMKITVIGNKRNLTFSGKSKKYSLFTVNMELTALENAESMVISIPFLNKPSHFYLNNKQNCFLGSGEVKINDEVITFSPENSFGLIDWGRGVWPYKNTWLWGNGSIRLANGDLFGFNIGTGFGDLSQATENMFFLNGKAYKFGEIKIRFNQKDYLEPWHFTNKDNTCNLTMNPIYDNDTKTNFLIIRMACHQVFGLFSGEVILEDGKKIILNQMFAFCEHCHNCW
ncbi:MAG: DUF2804 domain-containing protein [Bacilli bacterium]|nr:DUF2804 domain-containing protein [Bacilli bacterium]